MGEELAAQRLGVSHELAPRRQQRLVADRIRHRELQFQAGRVAASTRAVWLIA
jgi:hypothetical protein